MTSTFKLRFDEGLSSLTGDSSLTPKSNKISIGQLIRNKFQPRKNFNKEQMEEFNEFNKRKRNYSANSC